jgi:uncharacterized membrane protein
MLNSNSNLEDRKIYAVVYRALLVGMYVSTALFAIGVLLALRDPAKFSISQTGAKISYHWSALLSGLSAADPVAIIELGTLILILTPIARVLVSLYAFLVDRNWKYVTVTALVIGAICLSWLFGSMGWIR